MDEVPHLLGISGSLRRGSYNTRLLHEAARLFGPCRFRLADLRLPLYDADLEAAEGLPDAVRQLVAQIRAADAVLIATPEYNKNLSGVLKNALDWVSRDKPMALDGKPVAIMSAAAGRAGGERAQFSLRHCLTPFNPCVLQGPEVMVANAEAAFDAEGRLTDATALRLLERLMAALRARIG
ncbi:MAG: NAD(P)H-dependent FMN reductase [Paracoccaceae bacterium]|nr:MAG: NAD(P)H-dependent FMN reductase [Paracoccaceae bacterium]